MCLISMRIGKASLKMFVDDDNLLRQTKCHFHRLSKGKLTLKAPGSPSVSMQR